MNATRTMLLGMLFHDTSCTFEQLFETRQERADALIAAMRLDYDQVTEAELTQILHDPAYAEDPDALVTAVHQEYFHHEEDLDLHLGELEVPLLPATLHVTLTDHGQEIMAEAHPDEESRRRALLERTATMAEDSTGIDPDTAAPQLAHHLARALGEGTRIGLLSCSLESDGHWRPSLAHPSMISSAATLPEQLWIVTTEYGAGQGRSIEVNTSAEELQSGLAERLSDFEKTPDPEAGIEELRRTLEEVFSPAGGTVRIDHVELVRGAWTLSEDEIS